MNNSQIDEALKAKSIISGSNLTRASRQIDISEWPAEDVQKELKMLMSLHHPNILKVHEYTLRDNNTLVIVQDSCIEGTLAENISNSRIDAKKLMQDIAIGVRYLHKQIRLTHLNLSPESIFIRNGDAAIGNVYRLLREQPCSYRSPPEYKDGIYGYETDIWSMGLIFLEIALRCKVTIEELNDTKQSLSGLLRKIINSQQKSLIEWMLHHQREMRPSIESILNALNIPSKDEPQSAKEVVKMLLWNTENFWIHKLSGKTLMKLLRQHFSVIESEAVRQNPQAMYLLGRAYQTSDQPSDVPKAKQWLHKAADAGQACAYTNLYNFYANIGVVDLSYLQKGIKLNDNRCYWTLARQLGYGFDGVTQNRERALELMLKLPSSYPDAKYDIVSMTARIQGARVNYPSDMDYLLKEGAEMGDRKAIEALSDCRDDQGRYKEAAKLGLLTSLLEDDGSCIGPESQVSQRNSLYFSRLEDQLRRKKWLQKALKQGSDIAKGNLIRFLLF